MIPNMSFWHIDYFRLVIFKKQQTQEKLTAETFRLIKEAFYCRSVSLSILGREG